MRHLDCRPQGMAGCELAIQGKDLTVCDSIAHGGEWEVLLRGTRGESNGCAVIAGKVSGVECLPKATWTYVITVLAALRRPDDHDMARTAPVHCTIFHRKQF